MLFNCYLHTHRAIDLLAAFCHITWVTLIPLRIYSEEHCKHCWSPSVRWHLFTTLCLLSSLSFSITLQGPLIWGAHRTLSLHFYYNGTTFSNMLGEIIIPLATGDGHNPASSPRILELRLGACWRCWPLWWTIPIRGHCSWMQFREALGGALNLQPLQCLRIRKAKRWFEAICFSAVTPSPSTPQHAKHILFNPQAKFWHSQIFGYAWEKKRRTWT